MKEYIEYDYGIIIKEIFETEECTFFQYDNAFFLFSKFKRDQKDIEDIIELSKEVKIKKLNSFDIILNKDNNILTNINNELYVLLKLTKDFKETIDILDVINYNSKLKISKSKIPDYKNDWNKLWSEKVDYYEYQLNQLGCEKNIILESFSYYLGLAENAISIVVDCNKKYNYGANENLVVCHRRLYYPNYKLNYFNPISYIIDLEVRDVAEYIKSIFFSKEDAFLELKTYLKSVKLSPYLYQMLYARLLFPTYYFDLYDKAIIDENYEENLMKVINKVNEYEFFLKDAYKLINNYAQIEQISWL